MHLAEKLKEAHTFYNSFPTVKTLTKRSHQYIPNSVTSTKQQMMREIGVSSIDELYQDVPEKFFAKNKLAIPEKGLSEFEVKRHVEEILSKNLGCNGKSMFVGAGCWPHYVPAVVEEVTRRSELLTSYTPYQPEVSQGILQALFEYQSMMCELTGMSVINCSMYDWASSLGEAARMAARLKGTKEILVPKIIHPERLATLRVYSDPAGIRITEIDYEKETGKMSLGNLEKEISENTAAVYVENPSYLGFIESQIEDISAIAHSHNALFIVGVDPISLGVLRPPGDYGADIVIGEAQPLGNSMSFGGPLLGIMGCQNDMALIRQMPGRIIGMTTTMDGSRQGFCMTMQTREQHIRREKATSNICTNEALCAVGSAVYLASLGPNGLREIGETITYKTNYAIKLLSEIDGVITPVFKSAHFKEFTVNFDKTGLSVEAVNEELLKTRIQGGKNVSKEFPELGQASLFCVTEIHSKEEIQGLKKAIERIVERE